MRVIRHLSPETQEWEYSNIFSVGDIEQLNTRDKTNVVNAINSLFLTVGDIEDNIGNLPPDLQDIVDELLDIRDNMPDWSDFEDRLNEIVEDLKNTVSREEFEERHGEILEDLLERMNDVRTEITTNRDEIEADFNQRIANQDESIREVTTEISKLNNEIGFFVRTDDFNAAEQRLTTAESSIVLQEDAIRLRVTQTEFNASNREFEQLVSEINVELGRIDLTVRQDILDESFGADQWIVTRYDVDLGSASAVPQIKHIEDEESDVKMVRDAVRMSAFEGERFITHYFTNIRMDTARTVSINLTASDTAQFFLNGASIGTFTGAPNPIQIAFRQEWNTIEILHYNHTGDNHVDLGVTLSGQVDRMTANVGMGDRDSTRVQRALAGIRITLDEIHIGLERIEEIDGIIHDQETGIIARINEIDIFTRETLYNEFDVRIAQNTSRINAMPDEINMYVRHEFFDPLNDRYMEAMSQIRMLNDEIALTVSQGVVDGIADRLNSAEAGITIALDEILLRVRHTDFDELTGRVERNEASISIMPGEILSRVATDMIDPETQLGRDFESNVRQTAESIAMEIVGTEIDGITGAVREVESHIAMINNEIGLLARRDELDGLGSRVSRNEAMINITDSSINMVVRDLEIHGDRLTATESQIEMLPGEINLRISEAVGQIAIGTRNMIRNSAWLIRDGDNVTDWANPAQATMLSETHMGLPVRRWAVTGREGSTGRAFLWQTQSRQIIKPFTDYTICGWFRMPEAAPNMTGSNGFIARLTGGGLDSQRDIQFNLQQLNTRRGEWVFLSNTMSSLERDILNQVGFAIDFNGTIDSTGLMFVEGNVVPQGWVPAPEDAQVQIETTQDLANQVNNSIADISNDNVITPSEKQALARYRTTLNSERNSLRTQATAIGGLATELTTEQNAWNALTGFIDPLLTNLTTTQNTDGERMREYFATYTTAKTNLATAINQRFDDRIDGRRVMTEINVRHDGVRIAGERVEIEGNAVFQSVEGAAQAAKDSAQAAQQAAEDAQAEADRVAGITDGHQSQLNNIFANGTLTSVEIRQFRIMRDEIGEERIPIRTQATNLGEMATQLTNEQTAWNALNNFVNNLPTGANATAQFDQEWVRDLFSAHAQRKGELMGQIQVVLRQRAEAAQSRADAAHTIGSDAQDTANGAQDTLNENQANWNTAFNRASEWSGAPTGTTTTINGGHITTHTIQANRLAIGDFSNIAQVSEQDSASLINGSVVNTGGFLWIQTGSLTVAGHHGLQISRSASVPFRVGDQYSLRFTGQRVAGTAGTPFTQIRFLIRYHYADGWVNAGVSPNFTFGTGSTNHTANLTITNALAANRTLNHISFFIESATSGTGQIRMRDIVLNKMMTGELIVNGAISGHTITGAHIIGESTITGATFRSGDARTQIEGNWWNSWSEITPGVISVKDDMQTGFGGDFNSIQMDVRGLTFNWHRNDGVSGMLGGLTRRPNGLLDIWGVSTINETGSTSMGVVNVTSLNSGNINSSGTVTASITSSSLECRVQNNGNRDFQARNASGVINGMLRWVPSGETILSNNHQQDIVFRPNGVFSHTNQMTLNGANGNLNVTGNAIAIGYLQGVSLWAGATTFLQNSQVGRTGNNDFHIMRNSNSRYSAFGDHTAVMTSATGAVQSTVWNYGAWRPFQGSAFNQASSKELKTNIKACTNALNVILNSEIVEYEIIHDIESGMSKPKVGLIAEDAPEIVQVIMTRDRPSKDDEKFSVATEDTLGVDIGSMIGIAWGGIQDLDDKVEHLEDELEAHKMELEMYRQFITYKFKEEFELFRKAKLKG